MFSQPFSLAKTVVMQPRFREIMIIQGFIVVEEHAAEGGMATISKLQSEADGCFYALKRPRQTDLSSLREFYRELELTAKCQHTNVIRVYPEHSSSGLDADEHWILMDWLEGGDLFSVFKSSGRSKKDPLPVREAVGLTLQILSALEAVHEAGIIHCDVRPQNIVVDQNGGIKLIDFGVARTEKEISHERFEIVGGNLFISPEHGNPASLCFASDIYCAGLILYFLLTLSFPVKYQEIHNRNTLNLARLMRVEKPQNPRSLNPDIPEQISNVLLKSIQPKPKDRYESAAAFRDALVGALSGISGRPEKKVAAQSPAAQRVAKEYRVSNKDRGLASDGMMFLWFGAGILLVLMNLVVVVFLASRGSHEVNHTPSSQPVILPMSVDPFVKTREYVKKADRALFSQNWDNAWRYALKGHRELNKLPLNVMRSEKGMSISVWVDDFLQDAFYGRFNQLMGDAERHKKASEGNEAIRCYQAAIQLREQYAKACPQVRFPVAVKTNPEEYLDVLWWKQDLAPDPSYGGREDSYEFSSESISGPQETQEWISDLGNGVEMEFLPVAAGRFKMGSISGAADEKPVHNVTFENSFWLAKTEVTNEQYWQFLKESGYEGKGDADGGYLDHIHGNSDMPVGPEFPVCWVSWKNAEAFCKWLTKHERLAGRLPKGFEYTLPTEAQWEYACRAGTTSKYSGDLDAMAWYDSNSKSKTHPVGQRLPNAWGFYDMHGNVWEWCLDTYDSRFYKKKSKNDPVNLELGSERIRRGGSWVSLAGYCRSASRGRRNPSCAEYYLGFRVCLVHKIGVSVEKH